MKIYSFIGLTFLLYSMEVSAQLKFNKYDEVIAFSYVHLKIKKSKERDKIATLSLPAYNNDSLFWENNIKIMIPSEDRS